MRFRNNDLPEPGAAEVHVHWWSMQWISDPVEQVVTWQSLVSLQFSAAAIRIKDNFIYTILLRLTSVKHILSWMFLGEKNAFNLLEST